jgi:hypothetical protein
MKATTKPPRGIRNNNPGNIERGNDKWQGLDPKPQPVDPRFAQFKDPSWGIRALAVILINYQDKYGLRTIKDIIGRWAPTNENNTAAYAESVSRATGFGIGETLDMHKYICLRPIVEAIIRHECGAGPLSTLNTWYENSVIDVALQRAGVVQPAAVVAAVPVTKETVAATGTAAVGVAQIADVAPQIVDAFNSQQDHLTSGNWVSIVIGVLTIGFALVVAYSQIKKHQHGVVA